MDANSQATAIAISGWRRLVASEIGEITVLGTSRRHPDCVVRNAVDFVMRPRY
jgi:hypothetical protein